MQHRYHINVFWYPDDNCWISDVPDLKPCSAHGATPFEAVAEVEIAVEGWLEVAREKGFDIPVPRYRPAIYAAARAPSTKPPLPPTSTLAPSPRAA